MKIRSPISPATTSPLREAGLFVVLTILLTWLFWVPGSNLPTSSELSPGNFLLSLGSFVPLVIALLIEIWLGQRIFNPLRWLTTLSVGKILLALLLPLMIYTPVLILRYYQETLNIDAMVNDATRFLPSFLGVFLIGLAEETGWRGFFLPRLASLNVVFVNLIVAVAVFFWQLPVILMGRYNTFEDPNSYIIAVFLFTLLTTPFFNRLAMRSRYNVILPGLLRASMALMLAVYFNQGRADPLTDMFGTGVVVWLAVLNILLFAQLWQGRKATEQMTELERILPFELQN